MATKFTRPASLNFLVFIAIIFGTCVEISADNTTHASCGINHLRIDLDRRYYNASIYSAITLRDPACTASISPANITLGSAPHLCNWTIEETSSKITYRNTVIMKVHGVRGMVIRNQDRRIDVSCEYDRSSYVSAPSFKPDWIVIANEGGIGVFTFRFEMYTQASYASPVTVYPLQVKLRDLLYFQVTANAPNNSLVLLINQCYATPSSDKDDPKKYTFINNGCPTDGTVKFHHATGTKRRFSIQAFRFLSNTITIYVHCYVFLCHNQSTVSRCQSGCLGNKIRVRRNLGNISEVSRDDTAHSKDYPLGIGPIILQKDKPTNTKPTDTGLSKAELGASIGVPVGAIAIGIVVAVFVLKLKYHGSMKVSHGHEMRMENPSNRYKTEEAAAAEIEVLERTV